MEGKIDMAARRQVTNKLRNEQRRAAKLDKGRLGSGGGHHGDDLIDCSADVDRATATGSGPSDRPAHRSCPAVL